MDTVLTKPVLSMSPTEEPMPVGPIETRGEVITTALKTLLEEKHLYQYVEVEDRSELETEGVFLDANPTVGSASSNVKMHCHRCNDRETFVSLSMGDAMDDGRVIVLPFKSEKGRLQVFAVSTKRGRPTRSSPSK